MARGDDNQAPESQTGGQVPYQAVLHIEHPSPDVLLRGWEHLHDFSGTFMGAAHFHVHVNVNMMDLC